MMYKIFILYAELAIYEHTFFWTHNRYICISYMPDTSLENSSTVFDPLHWFWVCSTYIFTIAVRTLFHVLLYLVAHTGYPCRTNTNTHWNNMLFFVWIFLELIFNIFLIDTFLPQKRNLSHACIPKYIDGHNFVRMYKTN